MTVKDYVFEGAVLTGAAATQGTPVPALTTRKIIAATLTNTTGAPVAATVHLVPNGRADGQQVTGYPVDRIKTDPAGLWGLVATLLTAIGAAMIGFIQAGVGAVLRTIQDKLRETVSIYDFMTAAEIADAKAYTYALDLT